jgi:hypothetical protein
MKARLYCFHKYDTIVPYHLKAIQWREKKKKNENTVGFLRRTWISFTSVRNSVLSWVVESMLAGEKLKFTYGRSCHVNFGLIKEHSE